MSVEMVEFLRVIIPAVISAVVALIVAEKQNKAAMAETNQKHNEQLTMIMYRLDQLEKKMDKHNNLVERMTSVEAQMKLINK